MIITAQGKKSNCIPGKQKLPPGNLVEEQARMSCFIGVYIKESLAKNMLNLVPLKNNNNALTY